MSIFPKLKFSFTLLLFATRPLPKQTEHTHTPPTNRYLSTLLNKNLKNCQLFSYLENLSFRFYWTTLAIWKLFNTCSPYILLPLRGLLFVCHALAISVVRWDESQWLQIKLISFQAPKIIAFVVFVRVLLFVNALRLAFSIKSSGEATFKGFQSCWNVRTSTI